MFKIVYYYDYEYSYVGILQDYNYTELYRIIENTLGVSPMDLKYNLEKLIFLLWLFKPILLEF